MLGIELIYEMKHFDSFCGLCALVPGLLVSLGIYVVLGQENLDIILVLGGQKSSLEVLSQDQLLVYVSLA